MTSSPAKKAPARPVRAVQFQPPTVEKPKPVAKKAVAEPAEETTVLMDPEPEIEEETAEIDEPDDDEQDGEQDSEQDTLPEVASQPQEAEIILNDQGYPTRLRGQDVVREEILFGISPQAPFRYTRLILADDSIWYACRDCWESTETRGQIMQHRNATHGAQYGRRKPKAVLPAGPPGLDLVLEPRENGEPAPNNPLDWTFREMLAMMPTIAALGDLVDRLEQQRNDALALLAEARAEARSFDRTDEHKIANYEPMREELLRLRLWKRNFIKKFAQLGFKFEEETE